MESGVVRIGMICVGVILIAVSVRLNSVKRLVVNHAVIWGLIGGLTIVTGAVPVLSGWIKLLAPGTIIVFFCAAILVLIAEFQNSLAISQLTLKNRELAMHVALLNQECERLMDKMEEMEQSAEDTYEKDTVHS